MPADLQQSILNSDLIYALTRNLPNPELIEDETANNSNKTFTVPANQIWEVLWILIEFSTTTTVGDRYIVIDYLDPSDDVISSLRASRYHDASKDYKYMGLPGNYHESTRVYDTMEIPLPLKSLLPAGYKIRVYDLEAIDIAADDMIVHMMVNRFDV